MLISAMFQIQRRSIQCKKKTGTRCIDVERNCIFCTDIFLHLTGKSRKMFICRNSCRNDDIHIFRRNFCIFQRLVCCFCGHAGGCLLYRNMSGNNPGSRPDPFVRCFHDLTKIIICHAKLRKAASRSCYFYLHNIPLFSVRSQNDSYSLCT